MDENREKDRHTDPYAPPASPVADAMPPAIEPGVLKKIKHAWVAATISGCITLAFTLLAMSGATTLPIELSAWQLFDVALMFGLAFGIYKRSRACAILMLVYWVASKILIMVELGKPTGLLMGIVFGYFFWQGIVGTFAYHQQRRTTPALAAGGQ